MAPNPSRTWKPIFSAFSFVAGCLAVASLPTAEVFDFLPSSLLPSFLSIWFAFMVRWSGSQVELPAPKLTKPLYKFSRIGSGELFCLTGQK